MDEKLKKYFSRDGWAFKKESLFVSKLFEFENFKLALSWMVEVGIEAEKLDHHPNWKNVYNKVEVELQTHDEGAVTKKDLELAEYMDESYKKFL